MLTVTPRVLSLETCVGGHGVSMFCFTLTLLPFAKVTATEMIYNGKSMMPISMAIMKEFN